MLTGDIAMDDGDREEGQVSSNEDNEVELEECVHLNGPILDYPNMEVASQATVVGLPFDMNREPLLQPVSH
ncbi:hypothetical protein M427DRAFT_159757 [Gonapodya prolifera JEL478]|uniref:Uncharacterized protein n=1 Tax=Gonapodya prolifera (strain JEL478) TaxID=1344416 RepID=A0A139A1E6_GONPJ|nr:hypothetical protein M427DRAFT_159757 [Gonapodya prolifera JEL478]|eukprot:KXS10183.1 hypothetical protein M427DRAFT_159757 [Gonapodya prolifera JEL478]